MSFRTIPRISAAALGAAGVLTLVAAPAQAAGLADRYVALGDSFTAGPLVPPPSGEPLLCLRSGSNYPSVVAEAIGAAEFVDASCSGAVIDDMTAPQDLAVGPDNPAQFDALTPDTTLVTVQIGGNDFGFADIVLECAARSATDPVGDPCRDHYTADGGDELADRVAETGARFADVLAGIRERSPDATVAVVGYLQILPESRGCWPAVPISRGDVPYLDDAQTDLNAAMADEAAAAGAVFVDVFERGHDVCARPSDKWVEGIFPTRPAAPVHPNADGMAEVGARVVDALGAGSGSPLA
ncbi:SGNH/GDSL hydrolase family protein [Nocardiopsis trehalosi]|uniref:SGNH/GDSL hydrolase family protein n=1 Tax=Nocardiopsis trehalosi TaxID=109329 RepID=UPI0008312929|nr:SGNH/GDSL hydrolase family protein [Nocardiopsis trehalosi]